jgi:phosphohistidine phosphatase
MKTLYLLRHAHSDSAEPGQDDHDRGLSARGEQESDNVGAFMKEQGLVPDALFCSTSVRTKETVRLSFARIFRPGKDGIMSRYDRSFYLAPLDVLVEEIRDADDHFSRLLVVGHNPGLEDLAEKLAVAGGQSIGKFPPSALAAFTCEIEGWRDFSAKTCKLKKLFMP